MSRLGKRVEVLFSDEMARYLKELAVSRGRSVGMLVREAVEEKYGVVSQAEKEEALARLCSLEAPIDEWQILEQETIAGSLE